MRLFDVTVGGEQFSVTQHDDGTFSMPPELEKWKGHNVALKPSHEPVVVARKPLAKGLGVAQNVQQFGTGALNVDGCRIAATDKAKFPAGVVSDTEAVYGNGAGRYADRARTPDSNPAGRWPANVALDSESAAALDQQSGERGGGFGVRGAGTTPESGIYGHGKGRLAFGETGQTVGYGDSGGASRFFLTAEPDAPDLPIDELAERFMYCAKAPKSERPTYTPPKVLRLRSDLTPEQVDLVRVRLAEAGVRVD